MFTNEKPMAGNLLRPHGYDSYELKYTAADPNSRLYLTLNTVGKGEGIGKRVIRGAGFSTGGGLLSKALGVVSLPAAVAFGLLVDQAEQYTDDIGYKTGDQSIRVVQEYTVEVDPRYGPMADTKIIADLWRRPSSPARVVQ